MHSRYVGVVLSFYPQLPNPTPTVNSIQSFKAPPEISDKTNVQQKARESILKSTETPKPSTLNPNSKSPETPKPRGTFLEAEPRCPPRQPWEGRPFGQACEKQAFWV